MGAAPATLRVADPTPGTREMHPTCAPKGGRARRTRIHSVPRQRAVPITEERTQQ
jgi:hypothetical protein